MITGYFCKGLLIGLIFGVPAGAIGALTIGRTLEKGFSAGFLTGLGSSAADLIYSCVGVFGITVISDFLSARQTMFQVIGGILILLFGFGILCKKEPVTVQKESRGTLAFCFLSAFTTALVNPATVFSFMAAFAAFGIHGGLSANQGAVLIIGTLIGTLCWWLVLSSITAHFRDRITGKIYRWLNRILGCLMTGFGIVMVIQGMMKQI
ncbi:MAG: LysE family translocator [Acetatifactor muris]|nr:LysE family translocator [Acetatifactor muris]